MYVLGLDVGGSKTHCAVADELGHIIAEGFGGPGNHQTCGIEKAKESMKTAMDSALEKAVERLQRAGTGESLRVVYAVLGVSGADGPEDFAILEPAVKEIMGETPFRIVHDSWIGLRAATEDYVGVVSICGTGAGHSGRNSQGKELTLRNLDYVTGNYGGGEEIVQKALHYAFRSEEGTWEKSRLEEAVPEVFGVPDMEAVCAILRREEMTAKQAYQIPIKTFELARNGDKVAQKIITEMGYEEGCYGAAVLRRLNMCDAPVPVVLIGSLFRTGEPLLIDSYMKAVHEAAPSAYAVILDEAPVTGAVKLALDHIKSSVLS
ncbi:MAG: hypothetical protein IJ282_00165 [Lachnospiraceae bacterium]|nr:hypothetical protein [Lachnospiraceae bacterium]